MWIQKFSLAVQNEHHGSGRIVFFPPLIFMHASQPLSADQSLGAGLPFVPAHDVEYLNM